MSIISFLNTDLGLLLLGFALTTVLGAWLSSRFAYAAWRRETSVALFRKRYDEGTVLLDELGRLVGKRSFALQQLLWAIKNGQTSATDVLIETANDAAQEWNRGLRPTRAKILRLIGEPEATALLRSSTARTVDGVDLHSSFVRAHQTIFDVIEHRGGTEVAESAVEDLNSAWSEYLERLANVFQEQASSLDVMRSGKL